MRADCPEVGCWGADCPENECAWEDGSEAGQRRIARKLSVLRQMNHEVSPHETIGEHYGEKGTKSTVRKNYGEKLKMRKLFLDYEIWTRT